MLFNCRSDMLKAEYRETYTHKEYTPADYEHPICSTDDASPAYHYRILLDTTDDLNLYAEVYYVSCFNEHLSAHQRYSVKVNDVKKEPRAYSWIIPDPHPISNYRWDHTLSRTNPPVYSDQKGKYTCDMRKIEFEKPDF